MAIDFPNEPEVDEEFTVDDKTWVYDGTKWSLLSSPTTFNQSIDDLSDVVISGVSDGQVLKYDSTAGVWENGLGATNLDDLTDVTITEPAENEILSYNGNTWINSSAPETGTTLQKGNNIMTYLIMEIAP
jgi:hypothetical protein